MFQVSKSRKLSTLFISTGLNLPKMFNYLDADGNNLVDLGEVKSVFNYEEHAAIDKFFTENSKNGQFTFEWFRRVLFLNYIDTNKN